MAEVWEGQRAALGGTKAVAIKLLARDLLDDESHRRMFLEEARLSMLLTNSNVVQVFDVGESGGECYMVMEWVDGLNLSELARKLARAGERLPIVSVAYILGEILRALAYAHQLHHDGQKATIVHRDVSPQNVLVSVSGEIKLVDFGVARLAREETSGLHVKGKLRYMAPEQLRGRSREPTVDLYAVGAIFHELLEGRRFRETRDEADLYAMVLDGAHPPLEVELPAELARLHAGLLEPDPHQRIQSADEGLELLYSWPGYRNRSVELKRLVCAYKGAVGPRTGSLDPELVEVLRAQVRAEAPSQPLPQPPSGNELSSAPTRAHPSDSGGHAHTPVGEPGPEPNVVVQPEPLDRRVMVALFGFVGLGLLLGMVGFGVLLRGWQGQGSDARVSVTGAPMDSAVRESGGEPDLGAVEAEPAASSPEPASPEPASPGPASPEPEPPEPGSPDPAEPDAVMEGTESAVPAADPSEGSDNQDEAGSQPAIAAKPRPAKLRFVLDPSIIFVWAKIANRELALEPTETIELPPGRYPVYTRQTEADPWRYAGRINVSAGRSYVVTTADRKVSIAKR